MGLPFETRPVAPEDGQELRRAFEATGRRAWCYFPPFVCAYHLPPGREVLLGAWKGSLWLVQKGARGDALRFDLLVPPLPFAPELLAEFGASLRRSGLEGGRVLWADGDDAQKAEDAGFGVRVKDREYVYDPARVAALAGPEYHDLRKRVRRFERVRRGEVRALTPRDAPACGDLLAHWRRRQGRRHGFLLDWGYTRRALEMLNAWERKDLWGWGYEEGGRLAGFALAGPIYGPLASFFVLKADPDCKGLSDYLRWRVFCDMKDFALVNDAGDLDLPGLRQHKRRFRPVAMQPVYTIEPGKEDASCPR